MIKVNRREPDIADILDLSGTTYVHGTSTISDFVILNTAGADTELQVDIDGTAGVYSAQTVVLLEGVTGLALGDMLTNGNLIVN